MVHLSVTPNAIIASPGIPPLTTPFRLHNIRPVIILNFSKVCVGSGSVSYSYTFENNPFTLPHRWPSGQIVSFGFSKIGTIAINSGSVVE